VSTASRIEWTETTWNPTTGCDQISPGCDHCYALTLAKRLKAMGSAKYQTDGNPITSGPGFGVAVHHDSLTEPYGWRRPRLVFVNSMSDLFHARIPKPFIGSVWDVMASTPRHTYQVLTKRPDRAASLLKAWELDDRTWRRDDGLWCGPPASWPLPNVWLGTSIESAEYARRGDDLRAAPAAVRFLSLEPLLGPLPALNLGGIGWVIVGGESGPHARPLDLGWVRDIRDQCLADGVPFFFKQVGGRTPKANGRLLDGRTWDDMPARAGAR
jgi:protein gp37